MPKFNPDEYEPREPSYTISEFCIEEGISKPTFYKWQAAGIGPQVMRNGAKIVITHQERLRWQRERTGCNTNDVRQSVAGLRKKAKAAVAHAEHVRKASAR
jgi:hypothetical protein